MVSITNFISKYSGDLLDDLLGDLSDNLLSVIGGGIWAYECGAQKFLFYKNFL